MAANGNELRTLRRGEASQQTHRRQRAKSSGHIHAMMIKRPEKDTQVHPFNAARNVILARRLVYLRDRLRRQIQNILSGLDRYRRAPDREPASGLYDSKEIIAIGL